MNENLLIPNIASMEVAFKDRGKLLPIFILIDVSSNMFMNRSIDKANAVYRKLLTQFDKMQDDSSEYLMKVAVMLIGSTLEWCEKMTCIKECSLKILSCERGNANYKAAMLELENKLRREEFLACENKIALPFIIMITDDVKALIDCEAEISRLNNNGWFNYARRFVYVIGGEHQEIKKEHLGGFVKSIDAVIWNAEQLEYAISSAKPKTIGGDNSMIREHCTVRPELTVGFEMNSDFTNQFGFGHWDEELFI